VAEINKKYKSQQKVETFFVYKKYTPDDSGVLL